MYITRSDRRKEERTQEQSASWVNPSYSDQEATENAPKPRIDLSDVSGMIDALQDQESEGLADDLLSLDQLVGHMSENGIEPMMAED